MLSLCFVLFTGCWPITFTFVSLARSQILWMLFDLVFVLFNVKLDFKRSHVVKLDFKRSHVFIFLWLKLAAVWSSSV